MQSTKVAILYGIGEGDYHGRVFVPALKKAGFEVVRDAKRADIVVTHSGGCFFLPPLDLNQKFVLINPPYWPRKSLALSMVQKVISDYKSYNKDKQLGRWWLKTSMNTVHLMRYVIRTVLITYHAHRQRFYEAVRDEHTVVVRSSEDKFLAPNADQLLEQKLGRVIPFYRVPGQHDDCWRDPAPYISIVSEVASQKNASAIE